MNLPFVFMKLYNSKSLENLKVIIGGIEIIERWMPIKNYESSYHISTFGRVKSMQRIIEYSNGRRREQETRILQGNYSNGYRTISLVCENKIKTTHTIHSLVATHFIDNPKNKPFVNHKDGMRDNNRIWNLEWSTNSENMLHSYAVLKNKSVRGSNNGLSKLKECDIPLIRKMRSDNSTIKQIANAYNVSNETIRKILIGKNWSWLV